MTARSSESQTIRIEPLQGWEPLKLDDIWKYRELLYYLIWRDLKVSYARTQLGIGWAILRPVLTMAMFTVIFGWLTQLPSDGVPYPLFVFSALLPWQLFAHALVESGNSLVANRELITKVYFPRLFLPIAPVLGGLVDSACALIVLVALMLWYGIVPGPSLAFL